MSTRIRLGATLLRELRKIAAQSNRSVSELAQDALRRFVHSHRETTHLTRTMANTRRLRSADTEIETEIARHRRRFPDVKTAS